MQLIQLSKKIKPHLFVLIVPLALVVINFILKIRYVTYPSLAMDEPFSLYFSQFDIITIIRELSYGNNPPLYEIFLHFWTSVFGISELSVRLPSVIFSSISVFFIYQICKQFFNTKVAVSASLLFTLSNYELYFAQEARVYPLFMLLAIISMHSFMRLLILKITKTDYIIYIVASILMLYSHFFSLFILFIQVGTVVIWKIKNRELFSSFIKYFGVIFLFYLPYIGIFFKRFLDSSSGTWVEPVSNIRPLHSFVIYLVNETHLGYFFVLTVLWVLLQRYIIYNFSNNFVKKILISLSIIFILFSLSIGLPIFPSTLFPLDNNFSSVIEISGFLLFYLAFYIHFQYNKYVSLQEKIILTWFFLPCFIMFVLSFYIPMFINRYLIYCTPAFFILIAYAINKFNHKYFFSLSLLITVLMAISFNMTSNNYRDVKSLVSNVKEMRADSGSAIFICPDYFGYNFMYYYDRDKFLMEKSESPIKEMSKLLSSEDIFAVKNYKEVDSIRNLNNYDQIIYIDAAADFAYGNNNIKKYLDNEVNTEFHTRDSMFVQGIFNIYTYNQNN